MDDQVPAMAVFPVYIGGVKRRRWRRARGHFLDGFFDLMYGDVSCLNLAQVGDGQFHALALREHV